MFKDTVGATLIGGVVLYGGLYALGKMSEKKKEANDYTFEEIRTFLKKEGLD